MADKRQVAVLTGSTSIWTWRLAMAHAAFGALCYLLALTPARPVIHALRLVDFGFASAFWLLCGSAALRGVSWALYRERRSAARA